MRISIVSLSLRGSDDISVGFEMSNGENIRRESFIVSAKTVADLGLCVGECDEELFDAVEDASRLYYAVKKGASALAYGSCSIRCLCRKLRAKGVSAEMAQRAANELLLQGYLDPCEDAKREAERCVSKLWGEKRIRAALAQKGYEKAHIDRALLALEDDGTDFSELCLERLRNTVSEIPTDRKDRDKLIAGIQRYGFSMSEIRYAFERISKE